MPKLDDKYRYPGCLPRVDWLNLLKGFNVENVAVPTMVYCPE